MIRKGNVLPVITAITVLLAFCVSGAFGQPAAKADQMQSPTMLIDGRTFGPDKVVMRDGHPMVWIRDFDKFGWGKTEKQKDGSIVFRNSGITITFAEGKKVALVNRLPFDLPAPAAIIDGKLMVPLEFVCKSLGHSYNLTTRPVVIVNTRQKPAGAARPVASAKAQPPTPAPAPKPVVSNNWIQGRVLYAGAPMQKAKLRLITPGEELVFVKGQVVVTDRQGQYTFSNVPDGEYQVYAYVADNPGYFNRMSEVVKISDGARATAPDIQMGRVLQPLSPRLGSKVVPINGRLSMMCSTCPSADYYEFTVIDPATGDIVAANASSRPNAMLEASMIQKEGDYQWQVKAYDDKDQFIGGSPGAGADPWTFKLVMKSDAREAEAAEASATEIEPAVPETVDQ